MAESMKAWLREEEARLDAIPEGMMTSEEYSRWDIITYGLSDEDGFAEFLEQVRQMGRDDAARVAKAQAREYELADQCEPGEGNYEAHIACLNVAAAIEALEVKRG